MAWFNWQTMLMVGFGARGTRSARNLNKVRLGVEALEDRAVPSASPLTPTVNLTTAGSSGVVNGAIFSQTTFQPGNKTVNPFLELQTSRGATVEQGYNTDARPLQFGQVASHRVTHALLLSDVPVVTVGGVKYRQFVLDVNQKVSQPLLSLDELRIYQGKGPNLTGYNANTQQLAGLKPVYDLDAGADHWVELNGKLSRGAGLGVMALYVPNSDFTGTNASPYVYLYSKFGNELGANGGVEVWAVDHNPLPPPPPPKVLVSSISGTITDVTGGSPGAAMIGVSVTLTGTTAAGVAVNLSTTTGAGGVYSFTGLAAGTYTITEQPSTGFAISTTSVGTVGGSPDGSTSQLGIIGNIVLAAGNDGINYNFANWVPNAQS